MHQEANKGLFQIPQACIHGGKPSFPHQHVNDQELPTLPHYHHPQTYMHLNYQRLFLNTPKTTSFSNQFLLPHELSSPSEASSLTLNSADGIFGFNNSTETKNEEQMEELDMIVNERRVRRLISNRESARRSRMRKRKQLEELQGQVLQLLAANHQLTEKLNHVLECNYRVLQENSQLKEENSTIRMAVADFMNQNHDHDDHVGPEAVAGGDGATIPASGDEVLSFGCVKLCSGSAYDRMQGRLLALMLASSPIGKFTSNISSP